MMHRLPCTLVSIDAKDALGEHQTNVMHHIHKQRLDKDGKALEGHQPQKIEMRQTMGADDLKKAAGISDDGAPVPTPDPNCLSCFGAESDKIRCCNTCTDLRAAYTAKGWALSSIADTPQCRGQTEEGLELAAHEGCRLTGYLEVGKVAGSFHISPGKTQEVNQIHVYDLGAFKSGTFDISHTIHSLSFGQEYPGVHNPLDETEKQLSHVKLGMYQYYVKVVSTNYTTISGRQICSNQYSVTEHLREFPSIRSLKTGSLPGVFVHYEFSPMRVEIKETRKPLAHFLTQLCAIIGGVFTVAGIFDQILYHSARHFQKVELGKLG